MTNKKTKYLIIIHFMFLVYSITGVLTKYAALESAFSLKFIVLYVGVLFIMTIYALSWQKVIKALPLVVAYANKAVIVIWGLLWGVVFFDESITIGKIIGIIMVIIGIILSAISSYDTEK